MELKHTATAGTLESSDVQVIIEPNEGGLELNIDSSVINQYGNQIKRTVIETLENLEVSNAKVYVSDRGALDCIIRSRVQCAVFRAVDQVENIPWGGSVR